MLINIYCLIIFDYYIKIHKKERNSKNAISKQIVVEFSTRSITSRPGRFLGNIELRKHVFQPISDNSGLIWKYFHHTSIDVFAEKTAENRQLELSHYFGCYKHRLHANPLQHRHLQ